MVPPGRLLVVMVSGATNAIVAWADLVPSATLVAVTTIELDPEIFAGAVYRPVVEIVPTAGLSDHATAVFVVPETVAVNC